MSARYVRLWSKKKSLVVIVKNRIAGFESPPCTLLAVLAQMSQLTESIRPKIITYTSWNYYKLDTFACFIIEYISNKDQRSSCHICQSLLGICKRSQHTLGCPKWQPNVHHDDCTNFKCPPKPPPFLPSCSFFAAFLRTQAFIPKAALDGQGSEIAHALSLCGLKDSSGQAHQSERGVPDIQLLHLLHFQ